MAPSPTIPTSFVPKQPVRTTQRFSKSGGNTFLVVALAIFGISLLGSGGVFAYEQYLQSIRDAKQAEVVAAEENIDAAAVEEFIRTRDRFTSAKGLLDAHVASSNFFDLLETMTLQNVRFNSLTFLLAEDRSAEIRMEGVARTFNALAAQSSLFSEEGRIKRAIFSDITVNEQTDTVSFTLTADLAPSLLSFSEENAPLAVPSEPAPLSDTETEEVAPETP